MRVKSYRFGVVILVLLMVTSVLAACGDEDDGGGAENYPSETVTFFAGANPGSGWDTTARAVAEVLKNAGLIDEAPVVENIPGGSGTVALTRLTGEDKDNNYVLQVTSTPILSNELSGVTELGFRDTKPVARLIAEYYVYAVKADSDIQDFNDLISRLQADSKSVRIAGSDPGSDDWVAAAAVFRKAEIDFNNLTYAGFSGGAEVATAVLGGHADLGISGLGEFLAQIQAGEMRALAVTAPERLELLPDVPTVKEQGVDVTWENWRGFVAPPEMDDETLKWWQDTFAEMVETEEWQEMRAKYGWADVFMVDGFADFLEQRQEEIRTILEEAGAL